MTSPTDDASRVSLKDYFPLAETPDRMPRRRGRKIHRSAPYRWASAGVQGVKLQTVLIGSELHTTEAWLMQFFAAVTAARHS